MSWIVSLHMLYTRVMSEEPIDILKNIQEFVTLVASGILSVFPIVLLVGSGLILLIIGFLFLIFTGSNPINFN